MVIEQEDIDFIRAKLPEFEGWCFDDAAFMTLCLMEAQIKSRWDAGVLEIGVFKGKYLSLLYQRARRTAQPVLGIDTFQWSSLDEVSSTFNRVFGTIDHLSLVAADSTKMEPARVIQMLGGRQPSFISIDGDHSANAVRSDLTLSKKVLSQGGIIALDDVLNPKAIGVSEGFYRFSFAEGEDRLRPFAYCANKLFCAERRYHDAYKEAIWALVNEMPHLSLVQEFNRHLQLGRTYVEQELLGSRILIF